MTNEELAVAIRDGNPALIGELWERVEPFVAMKARDRLATAEGNATDTDDLTQSGYFALLSATQTFDPDGGRNFLSWLDYHLKNAFASTLGYRTKLQSNDPLRTADSLQRPISDEENSTELGDLQPDERAQEDFEAVEHRLWLEQLHNALAVELDRLPEEQRETITGRYYSNLSADDLAQKHGTTSSVIKSREAKGMRALRKNSHKLSPFVEENTNYHFRVGVAEFNRTHTSAVEAVAMWRESASN